jgi:Mn2+/Fe2+ NRAMP family transporter
MEHDIVVTYDQSIINSAAKHFWMKSTSRHFLIGVAILAAAFALWFYGRSQNWLTATLIALSFIYLFIAIALFFVVRRRSMKIFREMESPTASWRFTQEGFSIHSDVGKSEFQWRILKKLWCFDDVWLLLYANQTYSTLPASKIPEETKAFIVQQVRLHGGEVR